MVLAMALMNTLYLTPKPMPFEMRLLQDKILYMTISLIPLQEKSQRLALS